MNGLQVPIFGLAASDDRIDVIDLEAVTERLAAKRAKSVLGFPELVTLAIRFQNPIIGFHDPGRLQPI